MVISPNINHDSGKLKDAASLLLRGATLLNDPCPSCTGVQVRFENKIICINCCNLPAPGTQATRRESNFNNQAKMITDKELAKSVIQEKIMLLVQQVRDENDISSQKIKAELIDLYLRILEKVGALLQDM
jgi:UPF0148 protein